MLFSWFAVHWKKEHTRWFRFGSYFSLLNKLANVSLDWGFFLYWKWIKFHVFHISILSSLTFIWTTPLRDAKIGLHWTRQHRYTVSIVTNFNRKYPCWTFLLNHVTAVTKREIKTVFRTNSKRVYCTWCYLVHFMQQ